MVGRLKYFPLLVPHLYYYIFSTAPSHGLYIRCRSLIKNKPQVLFTHFSFPLLKVDTVLCETALRILVQ